jgi:hypothetical protein
LLREKEKNEPSSAFPPLTNSHGCVCVSNKLPYSTHTEWLALAGITFSSSSSPVRRTHCSTPRLIPSHVATRWGFAGDAGVGKSSLLVRLTDQRFLANPDPTVRLVSSFFLHVPLTIHRKLGVEFGSKLITIPEEDKVVKLQCAFHYLSPSF